MSLRNTLVLSVVVGTIVGMGSSASAASRYRNHAGELHCKADGALTVKCDLLGGSDMNPADAVNGVRPMTDFRVRQSGSAACSGTVYSYVIQQPYNSATTKSSPRVGQQVYVSSPSGSQYGTLVLSQSGLTNSPFDYYYVRTTGSGTTSNCLVDVIGVSVSQ